MFMKTVAQATKDLEAIAKQLGASGFEAGRKGYFASNIVTDDEGNVLDPASITVEVQVEKAAPDAQSFAGQSDDLLKSIRAAVRAEIGERGGVSVSKAASIQVGGEDRRKNIPRGKSKCFQSNETAYNFGRWIQAATFGDRAPGAVKHCKENGLALRFGDFKSNDSDLFVEKSITGHSESVNTDGGFLVPLQFDNELVWLREQYGVFRKYAQNKTMSSDRLEFLRKNSSHTPYHVGEGQTNTTSKMAFTRLGLTARKLRTDGYLTQELSDDAAINLADEVAKDIVEGFALKEDQDGFLGDGTSTYGGIVGLTNAFINLGTFSNSAGVYDATASTWETITLAEIQGWRALLPAYASGPNSRIFCSKAFYHTVFERLMQASGGTSMIDIASGTSMASFMGTPVEFVQAMPSTGTADIPDAFYGDLSKAATFGDRKGITFKTTDVGGNAWDNDEIAYKATERFDINIHDIGNNSATASLRKAGPLVALIVL